MVGILSSWIFCHKIITWHFSLHSPNKTAGQHWAPKSSFNSPNGGHCMAHLSINSWRIPWSEDRWQAVWVIRWWKCECYVPVFIAHAVQSFIQGEKKNLQDFSHPQTVQCNQTLCFNWVCLIKYLTEWTIMQIPQYIYRSYCKNR